MYWEAPARQQGLVLHSNLFSRGLTDTYFKRERGAFLQPRNSFTDPRDPPPPSIPTEAFRNFDMLDYTVRGRTYTG